MDYSLPYDEHVTVAIEAADAAANKTTAVLSNVQFVSSDQTIFTVAPDPANPNGAIITGVKVGAAVLNITATATEADGKTANTLSATVNLTLAPGVSTQLLVMFGTPAPNQ
ncbi:MAG TPA: hypothetical protein VN633_08390 [Bryobacteraceae bacterium]|nr:hypothetical protein [Bryobacteraceae bacterium]